MIKRDYSDCSETTINGEIIKLKKRTNDIFLGQVYLLFKCTLQLGNLFKKKVLTMFECA